ncbi:MAG TPA: NAD-dependent DNA ligase LigA [Clostridiales bacterium]|nr:NAD-dependent DNA ligase LigA [Clostridiales bacterium]HPV02201.1 NAD-dependent DNA ligase LigA [Clostridiales bacterium]
MDNMDKIRLMKEKIELLNRAAKAYYQENREIMSNYEYDKLYDELAELEKETGMVLSNSPTVRVGYELLTALPKERHEKPMLSLDKTKDVEALRSWLGSRKGMLSWKLDGLTLVLTYRGGSLEKAVTRGNGEVGEVVTNNVKVFKNIPLAIPYKGDLVLRGEAVISYSDFNRINEEMLDATLKYKNPRNLCSGSVRQLNNRVTSERNVNFFAFSLVRADGVDFGNSRAAQLEWLRSQGFDVVEYRMVDAETVEEAVRWFAEHVEGYDLPTDGLVLAFDDIAYGESLGTTAKFPRDSIAFKWRDEIKETVIKEIEWSASRTGLINPIAIFGPVELEGTTVSRASLHNISIMEELQVGIGDTVSVYKANMIIPQIHENLTRSGNLQIPDKCPVCGGPAEIRQNSDVKYLYCPNKNCAAKHIKKFTHFVSRDAMNVEGLSEATIEKFVSAGLIRDYADIYRLAQHREKIVSMEGFGEKSFANLIESVDRSRKTTAVRLLYGLGIPNIGLSNAKLICRRFGHDWSSIENATYEQLTEISGIGGVMAEAFVRYFSDEENRKAVHDILTEIELEKPDAPANAQLLENLTFVITGSLERFGNRKELVELIENMGGKVSGSVSAKTNYLINNDITSNSTKNKKAKELGIPIITEAQLLDWIENGNRP